MEHWKQPSWTVSVNVHLEVRVAAVHLADHYTSPVTESALNAVGCKTDHRPGTLTACLLCS